MKCTAPVAAALLITLLSTQATAQAPGQQPICQEEAFRLCQAAIPDHQLVFACLAKNKSR